MSVDDERPMCARLDAGESGCGALILKLRRALDELQADDLLELLARDVGAPADIPAWCGIAGHEVVLAAHPFYIIRKQGD